MAQRRPLGIRASEQRVEVLDAGDATRRGTYWFDLRTRSPWGSRFKRGIDILGAIALIILLAPLMLVLIVLIRVTSDGPAMFRQRRIGFRGNEFGMYKFRTMFQGAELLQAQLMARGSHYFKVENDPRVTRIGRFLRRFSLDELPQLFNVLEGSMSLVGPRPLLLTDMDRFPFRGQMRRFSVRPGVTGLWQVSGRNETTDEQRMRLDREYINEWSLWLDVKILARTIVVVLTGRGAM
jgi:lipopolysaccharide/colanic/teichoic acid biosynthesis glycosyltransferase